MKVVEDQVVEDEASFQDDEVRYTFICLFEKENLLNINNIVQLLSG